MSDFFSSEGVIAGGGTYAEYSGNYFEYFIDGVFDAYYVTRYAFAIDDGAYASLTGNAVAIYGSDDADYVQVAGHISAANNSSAVSYGNSWWVGLGDGDDIGTIHTSVSAINSVSFAYSYLDSATLIGGAGTDTLLASQNLSALDGGFASIYYGSRTIDAGEGADAIHANLTIESGRTDFGGGTATYSYNSLFADVGADDGSMQASSSVSAFNGGYVDVSGNSATLLNSTTLLANTSLVSGSFDTSGGVLQYNGNTLYALANQSGGALYNQNFLFADLGGSVSYSGNAVTMAGQGGSDILNTGVGISSRGGSQGEAAFNMFSADGGAGDDNLTFFLDGMAQDGSSAILVGNGFYGFGGDGNDSLNLNWLQFGTEGDFLLSENYATLDGGAGSDTLFANLGEGTNGNEITVLGGEGDDYIQTLDWGQDNYRLIAGGAGNDVIVDDNGFSTVQFEGAFSDYSIKNAGGGWLTVTDLRDGSPDGVDQLMHADQLLFSDGSFLISDLYLPIEGTEGDDTIFGGSEDDIILGYGGNDTLWGSDGDDTLDGGAGNDLLVGQNGNDTLFGGAGNDQVIGNAGADVMSGGAGADSFAYGNRNQSTLDNPDLIVDFSGQVVIGTNSQGRENRMPGEGDKIDLSVIDADTTLAGNQAFKIVQHAFSGTAGELFSKYDASTGLTSIFLDVDGDAHADMEIQLLGNVKLTGSDYIL